MEYQYIICHYGEIGLKGGNRKYFENRLIENIKEALKRTGSQNFKAVSNISGRILIKLNSPDAEQLKTITEALKNVFGVVYFSPAIESEQDMKKLKDDVWANIQEIKFSTFRITTHRSDKNFPMKSPEISGEIGAFVVEKTGKKVKLKDPDLNCHIELVNKRAFIFTEKIKGPGGMPVGSAGRVAILLSGGLDSPVAAFYALKRGCQTVFIHFHSLPFTSNESVEKVKKLAETLKKFNASTRIYLVPFADAQKEIMVKTPEKFRVILYRRLMVRIAEKIAGRERCLSLVTGDSLGQVASQTLENMAAVEDAATMPILRPLVGFDKEEIMQIARRIGTYDISIQPHDDCCVRFIPKHPETKARIKEVQEAEKLIDSGRLVKDAVDNSKLETI